MTQEQAQQLIDLLQQLVTSINNFRIDMWHAIMVMSGNE